MHPELEHRLRKHGQKAMAEVVAARQTHMTVTLGNPQLMGDTRIEWKLTVRVQPHGGATFDVDIDALFSQMDGPTVGSSVPVLYDPEDHSKVVIDSSPDGQVSAESARLAATMARSGHVVDSDHFVEALQESLKTHDPSALHAALRATLADGDSTDDGADLLAGASAAAPDPIELLAKLSQLHDKGVVTDAQFEAQKARLLGS
jgi:hypothetical protein